MGGLGRTLTKGRLAPAGPSVQAGLGGVGRTWRGASWHGGSEERGVKGVKWVGQGGPDGSWDGAAGSECPEAEWVGWGGPDRGRVGTVRSECPEAGSVGWQVVVHNVFCCPQAPIADPVLSGSLVRLYIGGSCDR
ncbi:hypothetical protein GCM10010483_23900 [Actinokineospora diospyrosa]